MNGVDWRITYWIGQLLYQRLTDLIPQDTVVELNVVQQTEVGSSDTLHIDVTEVDIFSDGGEKEHDG